MDTNLIIRKFKEEFDSDIIEIETKNQKRVTVSINPGFNS